MATKDLEAPPLAHWKNGPAALGPPVPDAVERRIAGRELRKLQPRSRTSQWNPRSDRRDIVDVVSESDRDRLAKLVPLRYQRMLESPFAFFRGAALPMALDLAAQPSSGLDVQLCGDAHLLNFGVFASPERTLLFDLNDFDETWPGPFEWDLKRLATSAVLASRECGLSATTARESALEVVAAYRRWMRRYADMNYMEVWY